MVGIYNTPKTVKGKEAATPRSGIVPPHLRQQRQQQMQQPQQQPQEELKYDEFQLLSTSKRGQNHIMQFKSNKKIEPKQFTRPVKLYRKDVVPYRQNTQNVNEQTVAKAAVAGTAPESNHAAKNNKNVQDLEGDSISPDGPQVTRQRSPKAGADTSLIAPLGGAVRNKQMLFKKRTKQIYLAKDDDREIKGQEDHPWILEDDDGKNAFIGTYEGGQRSEYMLFVSTKNNGFKVIPVDRWYNFQAKRNVNTSTLEEAEDKLRKQQKRENGIWMKLNHENEQAEAARPSKFKIVDTDDTKAGSDDEGMYRQDSDMDDLDFDDDFQDDDEANAEDEVEDEEVKEGKERVKKEIKNFSIGTQQVHDSMFDDMGKLTSEGKQMRNLIRDLEKNRAYESDEEADPYASSAEELDSDAYEEDQDKEDENKGNEKDNKSAIPPKRKAVEELDSDAYQEDQDKENENKGKEQGKKSAIPPKRKAVAPSSNPVMPKKARTAKFKKEGMYKPIGRPGSPSLYMNKRDGSSSPGGKSSSLRPFSPLNINNKEVHPSSPLKPSSPTRHVSPPHRPPAAPSSPHKAHGKKRKSEEVNSLDVKHRKINDLITEQEVIDTLRGKTMTTKDFLRNFRNRIKENNQNRVIITALVKKMTKHISSADRSTHMLELKPEYQ